MHHVLLVDDHAVVRRGIRAIFEDGLGQIDVVEAGDGTEALAKLTEDLDLVVLDLSMPGRSGIDLLSEIKHRAPRVPVLIMSLYGEEQFAVRALRAGASGYLMKSAAPAELLAAFAKITRGERYISESLAQRLARDVAGDAPPHMQLSDREFDVMRGIAAGETISEIAKRMLLSVKTVSTYRGRLLKKMHMETNAELTRYAIDNSLV